MQTKGRVILLQGELSIECRLKEGLSYYRESYLLSAD